MKTHTIKTPTAELLIVQLPHRTAGFSVINTGDRIAISAFDEYDNCLDVMPISTDYTLLGKPDEIREEDAKELVESFGRGKLKRFKGYGKKQFEKTATESLLSLLESEIYWENPFGESEPELEAVCCGRATEDNWGHPQCCGIATATEESVYLQSEWHEAEQKTFDRNRSIILVKQ